MSEQKLPEQWDKNDYLAFVLIYAARADLEISDQEWEYLDRKLDHHFYEDARRYYDKWTDYEKAQVLQEGRREYFPDQRGKEQLLEDIRDLFQSDEEYNLLEQNMLHILRQVL